MNYFLRTGSPFKLTYHKRKPSGSDLSNFLTTSRARSLKSLHAAYASDLAVEAERDSRRIFERSSAFEYWWDDNNMSTTSKPNGRFYTMPIFYHGKVGNNGNVPEKISRVDGMSRGNASSWGGNINQAGCDNKPKGDLKL